MEPIPDPTKIVEKITESIDDNIYSRQESEEDRTDRHLADMQSDNPLAKMIRPVLALLITLVWVVLHIYALYGTVQVEALYSADAALMTALGFYFSSRGLEKITKNKSAAAVRITKMNARAERRRKRRNG